MPAAAPSTSAQPRLPAHLPALDGLRGLAILLVLVHMLNLLQVQAGAAAYVFGRFSQMGWIGVQLFFVLSGFLITGILLETQRAPNYFAGFYARRVLRICPLYFAVLATAFIVLPAIGTVPRPIATDQPHQWWLWVYLQNWASLVGEGSKGFPHFWSLAVEEQFYLVWPWLIRSRSPTQTVQFCVGTAVVSLALRCILVCVGAKSDWIYENTFCRMDALALGGAAAAALRVPSWNVRLLATRNRLFAWGIVVTLLAAVLTHGFWTGTVVGETVGYSVVALMSVLLLTAAACADTVGASGWAAALRVRPLRAMGKYSYAMYVLHKPIHDYLGKPLVAALGLKVAHSVFANAAYVVIGTVVTFAAAVASWNLLEKHFLKLKRFFVPKPSIATAGL